MKINESQFADLKMRFEKYFQGVPAQIWFAGRKDAPSPARQIRAVQQMFGIDLSALGGDQAPRREDHVQSRMNQELRVDISRLEQWEFKQKIAEEFVSDTDSLTLEHLNLSFRAYNCLQNVGITQLSQLAEVTEADLLCTKGFGRKALNEVKEVLAQANLRLKSDSRPLDEMNGTQQRDLNTVVSGIKKLPEDEAREVSLCLLTLLLPFAVNNQEGTNLLCHLRNGLLGE